ncbi:MAG: lysophospholipid acyltransferase family protein [Candidatus Thalassarchaeaceae archaeon]|nr:lysophospholipid acyltransferase family protein [Candidatus Thalassarchaeaceae archaeon]
MAGLSNEGFANLAKLMHIEPAGRPIPSTPLYTGLLNIAIPLINIITRLKIYGSENIPQKGPLIVAANHLSHLDPVLAIYSSRRKLYYLAKDEHFKKNGWRQLMLATGQVETNRSMGGDDAIARAADVLNAGMPLGIFPEGTRSRNTSPPYLGRGKTGIARIAAAFPDVPIIFCGIDGAREILAPGEPFLPRFWKRTDLRYSSTITWNEWAAHENGGGLNDAEVAKMGKLSEEKLHEKRRQLYRKFTNQAIATLAALGAT